MASTSAPVLIELLERLQNPDEAQVAYAELFGETRLALKKLSGRWSTPQIEDILSGYLVYVFKHKKVEHTAQIMTRECLRRDIRRFVQSADKDNPMLGEKVTYKYRLHENVGGQLKAHYLRVDKMWTLPPQFDASPKGQIHVIPAIWEKYHEQDRMMQIAKGTEIRRAIGELLSTHGAMSHSAITNACWRLLSPPFERICQFNEDAQTNTTPHHAPLSTLELTRYDERAEQLVDTLTDEEKRILALKLRSCTNAHIADMLGVSQGTVKNRMQDIRHKLKTPLSATDEHILQAILRQLDGFTTTEDT